MKIPFRRTLGLKIENHGLGENCASYALGAFDPASRYWRTVSTWKKPPDVAEGFLNENALKGLGYEIDWTAEELDWLKKARETGELATKAADLSKAIRNWFNAFGETQ